MSDLRDALISHVHAIEAESRGLLPASGFNYLIDKGILPNAPRGAIEPVLVLPVVMSVGADNRPVRCPEQTRYMRVGLASCFDDQAVFAWMSGTFRLKFESYVVAYSDLKQANEMQYRDVPGVHVTDLSSEWTVLFAERLPAAVAQDYRAELLSTLTP